MFTLTASIPVLKIVSNKIEVSFETDYKSYEIDNLKDKFNSLNAELADYQSQQVPQE